MFARPNKDLISRLPADKQQRIFDAASNEDKHNNCFGTAAYVAGMLNAEQNLVWEELYAIIKQDMLQVDVPQVESLIVFESGMCNEDFFSHAGIVLHTQPLLIFSRIGYMGHCSVHDFKRLATWYPCSNARYYVPTSTGRT